MTSHVNPGETHDPPSVEKSLPVPLPVAREGFHQLVPTPGVPLNGKSIAGKCHVEAPVGIPRNRELESRLKNAAPTQHRCPDPFEWCPVPGTSITLVKDPTDFPDTRLASSRNLVYDKPHIIDSHAPIGNSGLQHCSEMSGREKRGQIDDRSGNRCDGQFVNFNHVAGI